jgi:hypothetical protein
LPIWTMLGVAAQVRRVVTQEGRSLLGRIVTPEAVNTLLSKLGTGESIKLTTSQIVEAALAGNVVPVDAVLGLSVKRSRVNGEQRLEVIGFNPRALPSYKAKGLFTEIIQFQCRLFVPLNQAEQILEAMAAYSRSDATRAALHGELQRACRRVLRFGTGFLRCQSRCELCQLIL